MTVKRELKPVSRGSSKTSPAEAFCDELKGLFNTCKKERENGFKFSPRWEYLRESLLKAARRGKKRIVVKNTDKDFGGGKSYAEWEIELFTDEYQLIYAFEDLDSEDNWVIYWL